MASRWNDASKERRLWWVLGAGVSEHFRKQKWDELPPDVQRVLAREMTEPQHGRCGSCGDWDCGVHNPCGICGLPHGPGANCY